MKLSYMHIAKKYKISLTVVQYAIRLIIQRVLIDLESI